MEIRLGTRRSDLARWQANHVADLIRGVDPSVEIRMVFLGSVGDKDRRSEFQEIGGIGVFTKESEDALTRNEADVIVHSLKDLPTILQAGLVLAAVPKREDPRDTLCGLNVRELVAGARIGTGSLRRKAQLLSICRDLIIKPIRGNVPPRLRKARNKEGIDATVLAAAGLARLGILDQATEILDPAVFPYAVGQGALGIEARERDDQLIALLRKIEDPAARAEVDAERALMRRLEAGCSLPVGVHTGWKNHSLVLSAQVTHPDGSEKISSVTEGSAKDAVRIGRELGDLLIGLGAERILKPLNQP